VPKVSFQSVSPYVHGLGHLAQRKQPVQKRAVETVNLILETAAKLIDQVGIEAFNTNLLAEQAGLRIRTIYRYFPNKLAILTALLLRLNDEADERMGPVEDFADPDKDWRALVDFWIDELMAWTNERPGARLIMSWSYSVPELLAVQQHLNEAWASEMMECMRSRGVDRPQEQLHAICRSVIEVMDALSMLAYAKDCGSTQAVTNEMRLWLKSYLAHYLD
jgi:AcrR family transcriptional regulator